MPNKTDELRPDEVNAGGVNNADGVNNAGRVNNDTHANADDNNASTDDNVNTNANTNANANDVNVSEVKVNDAEPERAEADATPEAASTEVTFTDSSTTPSTQITPHQTTGDKLGDASAASATPAGVTSVRKTPAKRWRSYWLIVPSAAIGGIGGLWLWALQPAYVLRWSWWLTLLAGALIAGGLLGGAVVLERLLPSFQHATKLLERALNRLPMTLLTALALAVISSVSEEVFFRGALFTWLAGFFPISLALVLQALVFAAFHPMPKRAWSYTAYTFVAGLVLGGLLLASGHLWASIWAHALVNFAGFLEVYNKQHRTNNLR
jgi:uncharacterized protein